MSDYMDGNMLGGTLSELFTMDVTGAVGTCVSCGARWAIAQARVYPHAPGMVARCPACDHQTFSFGQGRTGIVSICTDGCSPQSIASVIVQRFLDVGQLPENIWGRADRALTGEDWNP